MPVRHIDRTADAAEIVLTSTDRSGFYRVSVPAGTIAVDVLNARGQRVEPQPHIENGLIDIRGLRASTYTIRAHTDRGIRIRRFALMGEGASLWAIDAEPVR